MLIQQQDSTTYLLGCPKPRTLTTPIAKENVEPRSSHSILVGMQNHTATLEDNLAHSCKTKYSLTVSSTSRIPWYLPKGTENLCPHKNLHMGVYSTFAHNC